MKMGHLHTKMRKTGSKDMKYLGFNVIYITMKKMWFNAEMCLSMKRLDSDTGNQPSKAGIYRRKNMR